jgi:hypothetical protein
MLVTRDCGVQIHTHEFTSKTNSTNHANTTTSQLMGYVWWWYTLKKQEMTNGSKVIKPAALDR